MTSAGVRLQVGTEHETVLVEDLSRTQIVMYAGASGDFNPLHTDEVFATEVAGYPTVFAHGMLTMGMLGRMLTDWLDGGALVRFGVRFLKQVWPGDTITGALTIADVEEKEDHLVVELTVTARNEGGEEVVAGSATACLPPHRAYATGSPAHAR